MSRRTEQQVPTGLCAPSTIMRHGHFARGLDDVRMGRAFNDDVLDDYLAYERGRLFGWVAPRDMPLFVGKGKLNPAALRLFTVASERGLIL
jgi:hypothetical protein